MENNTSEIYKLTNKNIEKIVIKIEILKDQIITLKRRRDHLCIIRDEEDEELQKRMLKHYKKVEYKKSIATNINTVK